MKVIDFNGRSYNFPPAGHVPDLDDERPRSKWHLGARSLLRQMYPTQRILEEVPLPGIRLFADFYIPDRQTIIEVHGRQHYEFVSHFHGSRMGFLQSKKNDGRKREWCELNNIKLIVLPYDKKDDWRTYIEED